MGALLDYIKNIGYFLILMSLVSNVMPDNSYKKYCRMFCGLILVVLVINPFYEFLNYEGEIKDIFAMSSYESGFMELENQIKMSENSTRDCHPCQDQVHELGSAVMCFLCLRFGLLCEEKP